MTNLMMNRLNHFNLTGPYIYNIKIKRNVINFIRAEAVETNGKQLMNRSLYFSLYYHHYMIIISLYSLQAIKSIDTYLDLKQSANNEHDYINIGNYYIGSFWPNETMKQKLT